MYTPENVQLFHSKTNTFPAPTRTTTTDLLPILPIQTTTTCTLHSNNQTTQNSLLASLRVGTLPLFVLASPHTPPADRPVCTPLSVPDCIFATFALKVPPPSGGRRSARWQVWVCSCVGSDTHTAACTAHRRWPVGGGGGGYGLNQMPS